MRPRLQLSLGYALSRAQCARVRLFPRLTTNASKRSAASPQPEVIQREPDASRWAPAIKNVLRSGSLHIHSTSALTAKRTDREKEIQTSSWRPIAVWTFHECVGQSVNDKQEKG